MSNQFFLIFLILLMLILEVLMIFMSVAFLTLMERKFLGYIQFRKGPNKLGIMGLLQPFSDAVKLLSKEILLMNKLNFNIYIISPMVSMILLVFLWLLYPYLSNYMNFSLGFLFLMCCLSVGGYSMMLSGWSSNSLYAMLGSVRSLSQSISYEVSLIIIMLVPLLVINNMNMMCLGEFQLNLSFFIFMWPIGFMFLFSVLAELNRSPFDFSEGESELVSGFNVEYMSSGFIMIFLSEYGMILFFSFLMSLMFSSSHMFSLLFFFKVIYISMIIIWIRGSLPRFRYDLLMYLCWLLILPFSLSYLIYMIMFKFYMNL